MIEFYSNSKGLLNDSYFKTLMIIVDRGELSLNSIAPTEQMPKSQRENQIEIGIYFQRLNNGILGLIMTDLF